MSHKSSASSQSNSQQQAEQLKKICYNINLVKQSAFPTESERTGLQGQKMSQPEIFDSENVMQFVVAGGRQNLRLNTITGSGVFNSLCFCCPELITKIKTASVSGISFWGLAPRYLDILQPMRLFQASFFFLMYRFFEFYFLLNPLNNEV